LASLQSPSEKAAEERSPEDIRRQRRRSIAIALTLIALVVIFYVVTIVRLGGNVAQRAL